MPPNLDDPLKLRCGLELPGRIALAPLTNKQSGSDGCLSDDEFNWLAERARGGFAVLSTCAAYVSDEGKAWDGQLGIAHDIHEPGLRRLAQALKCSGTLGIVQLHHAGDKADEAPGQKLSTVDAEGVHGALPADLERVVADFVRAAQRAESTGCAGVEIHGANGYLFTQFLAPKDNPRTDDYGGGLVARARFLRETVCAVRAAVSPGFAVRVRLSPVDVWSVRGLMLEDGIRVAQWMADDGVDFVHLSLSDAGGPAPHEATPGPVALAVREALPKDVLDISPSSVAMGPACVIVPAVCPRP